MHLALSSAFEPLTLRLAAEIDAPLLFAWRNDPTTRENSRSTDVVSWEDHVRWLAASLTNKDRTILIAEYDSEPVGTIRLDYADEDCELSWTIAPEKRRRGLGKRMLEAAIRAARCSGALRAEIKPANEASLRMVRALGFVQCDDHDELTVWRRHSGDTRAAPIASRS